MWVVCSRHTRKGTRRNFSAGRSTNLFQEQQRFLNSQYFSDITVQHDCKLFIAYT